MSRRPRADFDPGEQQALAIALAHPGAVLLVDAATLAASRVPSAARPIKQVG